MARLNEPLVAPDGLEILRRRFLRQNRDIARINSTQSLRIRSLENECARMLSENLQLRGRILHLESEIRESSAQRIADHAMEIKEKMEAQLLEWGTMLASLGSEPLPRNRSPRAHKKPRLQPSPRRSSGFQWQRREPTAEVMREMEDAAHQEGRLAPIWENKPCPRGTLNREEILALCDVTDETSEPDLGPPPTSRYTQQDPVKLDLPTRSVQTAMEAALVDESMGEPSVTKMIERGVSQITGPTVKKSESGATVRLAEADESKSTLKRKARTDEERELVESQQPLEATPALLNSTGLKDSYIGNSQPSRPIKSLPLGKKDNKSQVLPATTAGSQRKPLGAKNSNDSLKSPKKMGKPAALDEITKAKADAKWSESGKPRPKAKRDASMSTPIQIPAPALHEAPVVSVSVDSSTLLNTEPNLNTPFSPESAASREDAKDTPPPAHISCLGETARASRRARPAVSYAEPNLRDKMRRPTKELFDAVSGEGKNIRRHSQSKRDDLPSALGAISISASTEKSQIWRDFPQSHITDATDANPAAGIAASPLATKVAKGVAADGLPISLATERKMRASEGAVGPQSMSESKTKSGAQRAEENGQDVYDFPATTPEDDGKYVGHDREVAKKTGGSRHSRARRLSSIPGEESTNSGSDDTRSAKASDGKAAARKRASMAAPKKSKMSLGSSDQDSQTDGDSQASILSTSSNEAADSALKDRGALRRRSMML
ncbi:uncharacterized protein B0I36DRAFT_379675 [Microdochium trichocladiopsis]|uniref:Shugoshin n=1 Tax=Microdochium trichocladiopsis TaxID=1682393 RepID=A0A9P8YKN3_9PEZI|nr:uncharacterized protein B0I36DRAFT_379675 [Microdochium trichocladiopsis]KAH7040764.1 hypothetical protein B0I36DRAFT_379675 [Microdochium trichocladiopsis]